MYRLTNYVFGFIIVYLFVLEAGMNDHILILTGFSLSFVIALSAFFLNWITLDSIKSVVILGTIVLGFGGWWLAFALLFFFLSGSLLSKLNTLEIAVSSDHNHTGHNYTSRRDGYQVWANGFWLAIFTIGWFISGNIIFLIAAFAAIATATADTWATEYGLYKSGKTINILTFSEIQPGMDGGISSEGSLAAVTGAIFISFFLIPINIIIPFTASAIVCMMGIAGCFIDSLLGAKTIQKEFQYTVPGDFSGDKNLFNNSVINWLSTGISGLLTILITHFLI